MSEPRSNPRPGTTVGAVLRHPVVAGLVLLAAYVALSFLNNPHGYLGTDTGAKVATLRIMAHRHRFDPDIGYWAARFDPAGQVHPFYQTTRLGHRYVIVTTLPALYLGEILYRVAGYRGALLVPELGSVAAAFAARALARRIGGGDGWAAFWIIGLASPLTIYALDFWEHSLGVALIGWGIVVLYDIWTGRRSWPWGGVAGLLFGAAATMRTESLVYGAIATGLVCLGLLLRHPSAAKGASSDDGAPPSAIGPDRREPARSDIRQRVLRPVAVGVVAAVALAVPIAANTALERATLGSSLRSERVSGTASSGGTQARTRVREAVTTAIGVEPEETNRSFLFGLLLLGLLLLIAAKSASAREARVAAYAGLGALLLYAIRLSGGLGFVPGLIPTTPLAAAGLVWGWRHAAHRLAVAIALLSLPLVWAFQFPGGAVPQWAGRYILVSGFLLTVTGIVSLPKLARWASAGFVAVALAVTAFGVIWLSSRSRQIATSGAAMRQFDEPVLVSRVAFLVREWGAYYGTTEDRRWLTAGLDTDLPVAADVLQRAGVRSFATVELTDQKRLDVIGSYRRSGPGTKVKLLNGATLRVTPYQSG